MEYDTITAPSYIGNPVDNTVMYITKKIEKQGINLIGKQGCLVFAEDTVIFPEEIARNNHIVFTSNPQLEYTKFVARIALEIEQRNRGRRYILHNGGYYVGENVIIGENSYIEPGVFIDHDVVIGKNATIKASAKIRNAMIGDNFTACEGSVIGAYGFTMSTDDEGNKVRIPTLGKVLIGNNVEIGVNDNVSCGSAGNTVIGNNTKLDALVHVAHDDQIGCNVELAAGVKLGGFVTVGDNTFAGINAEVKNRTTIGNNCFIGMGSVVIRNVKPFTRVFGVPAKVVDL